MIKKLNDNGGKFVTSCGCITYKVSSSFQDTQILLIKQFQDNNVWGIPKGKMNKGESQEDCAIRETREETGINVEIESRIGSVQIELKNKIKTVVAFLARQTCNNLPSVEDPESEVADVSWFSVKNLPTLQGYQKNLIDLAVENLRSRFEELPNERNNHR